MKKIALTRGMYALVDDDDYKVLNQFNWGAHNMHGMFYASRNLYDKKINKFYNYRNTLRRKRTTQLMHRVIAGAKKGEYVDHISGNTLDNRKRNLRIVNGSQHTINRRKGSNNTSGIVGVAKLDNKWKAGIGHNGKWIKLGVYEKKSDAIKARKLAVIKYHKEFARGAKINYDKNKLRIGLEGRLGFLYKRVRPSKPKNEGKIVS